MDEAIGTAKGGGPQRRRMRRQSWTKARRKRFLDTLAASCNVTMACQAAGMNAADFMSRTEKRALLGLG